MVRWSRGLRVPGGGPCTGSHIFVLMSAARLPSRHVCTDPMITAALCACCGFVERNSGVQDVLMLWRGQAMDLAD